MDSQVNKISLPSLKRSNRSTDILDESSRNQSTYRRVLLKDNSWFDDFGDELDLSWKKLRRKHLRVDSCRDIVERTHKNKIHEVMAVKTKLASRRVICSIKSIESGLLYPDMPFSGYLSPDQLPKGGEGLLPMLIRKRKKKKNKKKRKH